MDANIHLLESFADDNLYSGDISYGQKLYDKWSKAYEKQNYCQQCFSNSTARHLYCENLLRKRAKATSEVFERNPCLQNKVADLCETNDYKYIKVLSLGCGPMSDFIGFRQALMYGMKNVILQGQGIDSADWSEYCSIFDGRECYTRMDLQFQKMRASKFVRGSNLIFDMTIMSYCDANVMSDGFWSRVKDISKLVVVIDNNLTKLQEIMENNDFIQIQGNYGKMGVFYFDDEDEEDDSDLDNDIASESSSDYDNDTTSDSDYDYDNDTTSDSDSDYDNDTTSDSDSDYDNDTTSDSDSDYDNDTTSYSDYSYNSS